MADKPVAPAITVDASDEFCVLGGALSDPATRRRAAPLLTVDDFQKPEHRLLWEIVVEMDHRNLSFSEDTVNSLAGNRPRDDWGGFEYLRALVRDYGRPLENLDFHVQRIRLARFKLQVAGELAQEILGWCEDPKGEAAFAQRWALAFAGRAAALSGARASNAQDVISATWKNIERNLAGEGLFVGVEDPVVDEELSVGFVPGNCSVIGARPGIGKSTWIIRLITKRANRGVGTCYISCESVIEVVGAIMCAQALGIPQDWLMTRKAAKNLSAGDLGRVKKFLQGLWNAGPDLFEIVENPFMEEPVAQGKPGEKARRMRRGFGDFNDRNMDELEAICARSKHKLVAVDLAAYAIPETKVELFDEALIRGTKIAKRHQVHLMWIHHLKRGDSKKPAGPPCREDLRATGGWENYMDFIGLLDRPKERLRKKHGADTLDFICDKQRDGHKFRVTYDFHPEVRDFDNPRLCGLEQQDDVDASDPYDVAKV